MNFSISELTYSDTANRLKINNHPDLNSLDCMLDLICDCLQPIRDKLGKPMMISSGYRCYSLNKAVGGVQNSQHRFGQAVDFTVKGMSIYDTIEFIKKSGVPFDQLIDERTWVHISYRKGNNRKQVLRV
mgnify:CR=1 FL=1